MHRRLLVAAVAASMMFVLAGCHNKKVQNPIADVNSKQPDKVLFDRAMDAMKHTRYEVARMTLQTLINTYPDSEFVARAKLAVGDSWYAEGGSAAMAQAENEYNDFITFFPNMPEAAEAQMKIGKIHYDQMEKADRDFTHAKRAEQAYREMVRQFPDSQLVPQAKERLREVQEVLAEREFLIGRFYYVRGSYPASIARLKSMVDAYPLYSGADEALFMLGDSYEKEIEIVRQVRGGNAANEARKGQLIEEFTQKAADAYSRIVTRYPVMPRANEAKQRLEALKRPVPVPTPEAIAQNKAEEESRKHMSFRQSLMLTFHRRPDISETARVGEPTMTDPKQASAPEFAKHAGDVLAGKGDGTKSLTIEQAGTGTPQPNQPIPRSDTEVDPSPQRQDNGIPELPITNQQPSGNAEQNATPPAVPAHGAANPAPPMPPSQTNEIKNVSDTSAAKSQQSASDNQAASSSKKKKKSGLGKIIPF